MKIKVSEASGPVLDWMVAKCEGRTYRYFTTHGGDYNGWTTGPHYLHYSTDWSQGGPIIEREEIEIVNIVHVFQGQHLRWRKSVLRPKFTFQNYTSRMTEPVEAIGPTPLVAAMRCFVASKLGDEVDVPDELL